MGSSSKIFALLFIISFLSISAAAATTPEVVSGNLDSLPHTDLNNIIWNLRPTKMIIGGLPPFPPQPDLPPVETQLHDNDLPVPPTSDNPAVTPQFFGFFRLIPKVLPLIPKIIGLPDLPLPPPSESEEAQLNNNDRPSVPVAQQCPIDTQKLGACMDLIGSRRSAMNMNECCPILGGLVEAEAAVCMCTTLKQKALDVKVFVPIALQVLTKCGKTPPPSYTCDLSL